MYQMALTFIFTSTEEQNSIICYVDTTIPETHFCHTKIQFWYRFCLLGDLNTI